MTSAIPCPSFHFAGRPATTLDRLLLWLICLHYFVNQKVRFKPFHKNHPQFFFFCLRSPDPARKTCASIGTLDSLQQYCSLVRTLLVVARMNVFRGLFLVPPLLFKICSRPRPSTVPGLFSSRFLDYALVFAVLSWRLLCLLVC